MSYASVSDVSVRLGRPIADAAEVAQVSAWLSDVESVIGGRFRRAGLDLSAAVVADPLLLDSVIRVESEAVERRINQPNRGLESVTRNVDDASLTERYRSSLVGDDGWLTAADWADLLPVSANGGAFSTRPGFVPDRAPCEWWPTGG